MSTSTGLVAGRRQRGADLGSEVRPLFRGPFLVLLFLDLEKAAELHRGEVPDGDLGKLEGGGGAVLHSVVLLDDALGGVVEELAEDIHPLLQLPVADVGVIQRLEKFETQADLGALAGFREGDPELFGVLSTTRWETPDSCARQPDRWSSLGACAGCRSRGRWLRWNLSQDKGTQDNGTGLMSDQRASPALGAASASCAFTVSSTHESHLSRFSGSEPSI